MERRFQRMKHNDVVSKYRREAKAVVASKGTQWAKKMVEQVHAGEALAVVNRAKAQAGSLVPAVLTPTPHVVVRAPFNDPEIPFKSMSIVFEVGATIGSRVALNQRDKTLAGENLPSLMLSISKLGTEDYRVYPSFEAAQAAAEKDNEAINSYMERLRAARVAEAA